MPVKPIRLFGDPMLRTVSCALPVGSGCSYDEIEAAVETAVLLRALRQGDTQAQPAHREPAHR